MKELRLKCSLLLMVLPAVCCAQGHEGWSYNLGIYEVNVRQYSKRIGSILKQAVNAVDEVPKMLDERYSGRRQGDVAVGVELPVLRPAPAPYVTDAADASNLDRHICDIMRTDATQFADGTSCNLKRITLQ